MLSFQEEFFDTPVPRTEAGDKATENVKRAEDWFILWHLKKALYLRSSFPHDFLLHYWACWQEAKSRKIIPDWTTWSSQVAAEPI